MKYKNKKITEEMMESIYNLGGPPEPNVRDIVSFVEIGNKIMPNKLEQIKNKEAALANISYLKDRLTKPINAKYEKKGSDYKPGTRVPAIEESLMKDDNLG